MDQDDSQFSQSLPVDVIQLLQCVQSGAAIPFKTQVIIITLLIMHCFVDPAQPQTENSEINSRVPSDSLTYFRAWRI